MIGLSARLLRAAARTVGVHVGIRDGVRRHRVAAVSGARAEHAAGKRPWSAPCSSAVDFWARAQAVGCAARHPMRASLSVAKPSGVSHDRTEREPQADGALRALSERDLRTGCFRWEVTGRLRSARGRRGFRYVTTCPPARASRRRAESDQDHELAGDADGSAHCGFLVRRHTYLLRN